MNFDLTISYDDVRQAMRKQIQVAIEQENTAYLYAVKLVERRKNKEALPSEAHAAEIKHSHSLAALTALHRQFADYTGVYRHRLTHTPEKEILVTISIDV